MIRVEDSEDREAAGWAASGRDKGLSMQIAIRNDLNDDQSRTLMLACNQAWSRIIEANMLPPMQQEQAQNILCMHLLRLVRRGELNVGRLARRGVFLISAILACPDCNYIPGQPLRTDGADIIF